MLLRVRVRLPDRPGALGQVAQALGGAGADIVQMVVLERRGGRAVDDFTMLWPGGARVERLRASLDAVAGVRVEGMWGVAGTPESGSHDAQLLAQVAGNPGDGVATLVDAVPAMFAADWAATVAVPPDWAEPGNGGPVVLTASWQVAAGVVVPEVSPLQARALAGPAGEQYAVAPFERAGLVLIAARVPGPAQVPGSDLPPAQFHRTEVDRLAQLVRAAAAVLAEALERRVTSAAR